MHNGSSCRDKTIFSSNVGFKCWKLQNEVKQRDLKMKLWKIRIFSLLMAWNCFAQQNKLQCDILKTALSLISKQDLPVTSKFYSELTRKIYKEFWRKSFIWLDFWKLVKINRIPRKIHSKLFHRIGSWSLKKVHLYKMMWKLTKINLAQMPGAFETGLISSD